MAKVVSVWRSRAAKIITEVLSRLPVGSDYKTRRRAITRAYPWQRVGFAYQCWLSEARRLNPPDQEPVRVLARPNGVDCGWCRSSGGCLACSEARERWRQHDWSGWVNVPEAADSLLVYADWLEERDYTTEADEVRERATELMNPRKRRVKR